MNTIPLPGDRPDREGPERVPLVRLANQPATSLALTRIVPRNVESRGPGTVSVAAFQSSV
jgi:FXSXX-COOH protein